MTNNALNNTSSDFTIDPLTAADSFIQFDEVTVGKWRIGNDETDDSFTISSGSALGTNNRLNVAADGITTIDGTASTVSDTALQVLTNNDSNKEIRILNSSDTSSADASFVATVGGTSGGDPQIKWLVTGGSDYTAGIDNSDADKWKLTLQNGLGASPAIVCTTAGEVTFPVTPAFLAFLPSGDNNVTGDGTQYTIGTNVAFTEVYDQNADFNTNGTFTAPVTGRYYFTSTILLTGVLSTHTGGDFQITASNRVIRQGIQDFGVTANVSGELSVYHNTYVDMDAADIINWLIRLSNGPKVVDINGSTSPHQTVVSGMLAC